MQKVKFFTKIDMFAYLMLIFWKILIVSYILQLIEGTYSTIKTIVLKS